MRIVPPLKDPEHQVAKGKDVLLHRYAASSQSQYPKELRALAFLRKNEVMRPRRDVSREEAEAEPTESEVARSLGGYTLIFILIRLCLQSEAPYKKGLSLCC